MSQYVYQCLLFVSGVSSSSCSYCHSHITWLRRLCVIVLHTYWWKMCYACGFMRLLTRSTECLTVQGMPIYQLWEAFGHHVREYGISREWLVRFSEQYRNEDRGIKTRLVDSCVIRVWMPNTVRLMSEQQWSISGTCESCVSTFTTSPSIVMADVVLRVTNWHFRLKVR